MKPPAELATFVALTGVAAVVVLLSSWHGSEGSDAPHFSTVADLKGHSLLLIDESGGPAQGGSGPISSRRIASRPTRRRGARTASG